MGTSGQFEIERGNGAGRFLLDEAGRFKICGHCCDDCVNLDPALFSPTGYKIKDYADGLLSHTCGDDCAPGTAAWDGSFPYIRNNYFGQWSWCVQPGCPFWLDPPLCVAGKQIYGYYTQISFTGGTAGQPCWTLYLSTPGWTFCIATKAKGKTPAGRYVVDQAWMEYIADCHPVYPPTLEVVPL